MNSHKKTTSPSLCFSDEERILWLQLIRTKKIGIATFQNLLEHFGTAEKAIASFQNKSPNQKNFDLFPRDKAIQEIETASHNGARIVLCGEEYYPNFLTKIGDAPPLLCIKGAHKTLAQKPMIAIIGSRNASIAGLKLTQQIAYELGQQGIIVVSGLARGIDTSAHKASLKTGTICVTAGGLGKIYPKENAPLLEAICGNGGAAISEMPWGFTARAQDFPKRNRIVAGMCQAVIVIEAARRSGALITARLAGEYGRQLFATPGFPLDGRSEGTNHIIRQGATLIRNAQDVLEDLSKIYPELYSFTQNQETQRAFFEKETQAPYQASPSQSDEQLKKLIHETMSNVPVSMDDLAEYTKTPIAKIRIACLELEFDNQIITQADGRFVRNDT